MGNAAAKASAQALVATQLSTRSNYEQAAVIAQYGPIAQMTVQVCKTIGVAYPKK